MDIRAATDKLLRDPKIGELLRLADNYIQAYNRMPQGFVLPAEHIVLRPIIEAFAKAPSAFVEYLRAMRDGTTGVAFDELHELYRTVAVRALQNERRTRMRKAVVLLTPEIENALGRSLTYDEQLQVAKVIEKCWGGMRVALMDKERNLLTSKRLPSEERAAILEAYWSNIDKKLEKGEVVMDSDTFDNILEVLK